MRRDGHQASQAEPVDSPRDRRPRWPRPPRAPTPAPPPREVDLEEPSSSRARRSGRPASAASGPLPRHGLHDVGQVRHRGARCPTGARRCSASAPDAREHARAPPELLDVVVADRGQPGGDRPRHRRTARPASPRPRASPRPGRARRGEPPRRSGSLDRSRGPRPSRSRSFAAHAGEHTDGERGRASLSRPRGGGRAPLARNRPRPRARGPRGGGGAAAQLFRKSGMSRSSSASNETGAGSASLVVKTSSLSPQDRRQGVALVTCARPRRLLEQPREPALEPVLSPTGSPCRTRRPRP